MNSKFDKIKVIFLDIDGTLYNSKKKVTEYTKNILNKVIEKGIDVVLCSGRPSLSVCEISKDINASKYVIGCNGAFVYDYKENIEVFESVMKKEDIERIWSFCNKQGLELILESKDEKFINQVIFETDSKEYTNIDTIKDIYDKKIFQIVINFEKDRDSETIKDMLSNEKDICIVNYGIGILSGFFDINNKNIDKGIGIENLINYLGIEKGKTMCFGDGVNDIAMFRECGIGVAMGNAKEELKNIADYITLTNDEDGVAKFIEKYILN